MTKKKIATLSPERWLGECKTSFPDGKNPWIDLYTESVTKKIGNEIGLDTSDKLLRLRLLLAFAAEEAFHTFNFVGGAAATGKKSNWRLKAKRQTEGLKKTLLESEDMLSSIVQRNMEEGTAKLVTSSDGHQKIETLISKLDKFLEFINAASDQPVTDDESSATDAAKTQHIRYLQFVVDTMTEVFINFRGRRNVKRASDDYGVYGPYPEFIRAAASHCLMAFYAGYRDNPKRPSKLDTQIQVATEKYGF